MLQGNNSILKNPKIRRRREQLGQQLFTLVDSFGPSRAGCNVSVYLCILYQCVFDQYILFLRRFFYFDPLLCTLILMTMMSLKTLSLFRRYQSTSHCIEMTTIHKKDKKKRGKHTYKRVTFVMVFCGINTNIMYDPSCNKESQ